MRKAQTTVHPVQRGAASRPRRTWRRVSRLQPTNRATIWTRWKSLRAGSMDENGSPLFGLALNCSRRSSSATTNWRAAQLQRPHKRNRELSRWRRAASAQHRLSGQEYRRNQRTGRHLHLPLNRRPKVKLLLPLQLLRRRRRLLANRPCSSMATSTTMSMSQQQRKASFELKLEIQLNPSQSSSIVVHEIPPTVSSIDQRPSA